jgi:hypothetical protein
MGKTLVILVVWVVARLSYMCCDTARCGQTELSRGYMTNLIEQLQDHGCDPIFIENALAYSHLYEASKGIEKFVADAQYFMEQSEDADYTPDASMDRGVYRAEKDYAGDVLTYHGFDLENGSKRY